MYYVRGVFRLINFSKYDRKGHKIGKVVAFAFREAIKQVLYLLHESDEKQTKTSFLGLYREVYFS